MCLECLSGDVENVAKWLPECDGWRTEHQQYIHTYNNNIIWGLYVYGVCVYARMCVSCMSALGVECVHRNLG